MPAEPCPLGAPSTEDDFRLARRLAYEAGQVLLSLRLLPLASQQEQLRAAGDRVSNAYLLAALRAARPDDAVLSEEAADDRSRLSAERVWVVDPLDGTREYGEGRGDWAVHVALWTRDTEGDRLSAGAVSLPARSMVLAADGTLRCPTVEAEAPVRVAVSRSRPPALLQALGARVELQHVPMGSVGVKVAAVLTGEVDAYVHSGGAYEWDTAAPAAVAAAAGAHVSRLDGSPLRYNKPDVSSPDMLVCRPGLADDLLAALADVL